MNLFQRPITHSLIPGNLLSSILNDTMLTLKFTVTSFVFIQLYYLIRVHGVPTSSPAKKSLWHKQQLFEEFKISYNITFNSTQAENKAFQNFLYNLFIYYQRNSMPESGTARFGITEFSHLSHEEFSAQRKGFILSEGITSSGNFITVKPEEILGAETTVAKGKIDWTGVYTTPIKNQGSCGSCWIFSSASQLESDSIRLLKQSTTQQLSEQQVMDCFLDSTYNICGGGTTALSYKYIRKIGGLMTEAQYGYTGTKGKCSFQLSSVVMNISSFHFMSNPTESQMAVYIQTIGPLSVCIATGGWQVRVLVRNRRWR